MRTYCNDCALKHLGAAFVLMDEAAPCIVTEARRHIAQASILWKESQQGYPSHKVLMTGHLEIAERWLPIRSLRIAEKYDEIFVCTARELAVGHLYECAAECPDRAAAAKVFVAAQIYAQEGGEPIFEDLLWS